MSVLLLALFVMAVAFVYLISHPPQGHGVRAMRSEPLRLGPEFVSCGNCHETGQEGFGLADWGECQACDGRGYFKVDPNAKRYTLAEFMELAEKEQSQGGSVGQERPVRKCGRRECDAQVLDSPECPYFLPGTCQRK